LENIFFCSWRAYIFGEKEGCVMKELKEDKKKVFKKWKADWKARKQEFAVNQARVCLN
jgi:hypothetical protein